MLVTMTARLVRSHGKDEVPLPGGGRIEYTPATHGIYQGALRGTDMVVAEIEEGVAEPVELTPGTWRVYVRPKVGSAWPSFLVELTEGMPEPVDLVDLAPVLVVDGEKWTVGPAGASVTGAVDNGDQTVSFTLSDGTMTDPVEIPAGPAGVGVASISDPDTESRVTVTYTDGSTSTVQAIAGRPGDDGHTPVIEWYGTALAIDGETGPDLKGEPGDDGKDSTVPGPPGIAELPDTGWRNVTALFTGQTSGSYYMRRLGHAVTLAWSGSEYPTGSTNAATLPNGFRSDSPVIPQAVAYNTGTPAAANPRGFFDISGSWQLRFHATSTGTSRGDFAWTTSDPFPTTLPGDAA